MSPGFLTEKSRKTATTDKPTKLKFLGYENRKNAAHRRVQKLYLVTQMTDHYHKHYSSNMMVSVWPEHVPSHQS